MQGRKPLYGVWYDVEDSQIAGADLVATCQTFCAAMEAAGLYAGIYASLSWLTTKLNSPQLDPYDKWVAQWNSACTYPKPYGIWQYTDRLAIGGQVFDGNWAYRDYPALTGEEEDTMTQAEVIALARAEAQKVYNENEAKYKTLASLPSWAKAPVEQVYRELGLAGTGGPGQNTQLDASETYIRALTVIAKVLEKLDAQP